MKKMVPAILISTVLGVGLLSGCGNQDKAANAKANEVVVIKAQTAGAEKTRVDNLVKAAAQLNSELKKEGKNTTVRVETNDFQGSWDDYAKQFMLSFKAKKEADIYATGHDNIGWLADGHYIQPLDDVKKDKAYTDVFPTLWKSVKYKNHTYGIPQDTEARPVFFNKDVLKQLGWSDDQINNLPELVKKGEFTLDDMTKLAEEAKAKGFVQYGVIHRPVDGPDFQELAYDYGAKLYDQKENKLVLDKKAVLKQLNYFYDLAQKKLIPDNLTSMDWPSIHKTVVNGKSLFFYGGIWNVFNWSQDNFHDKLGKVDAKWVNDHFGMMLIPAADKGGKAVTLSHPFVYTVSSQSKHPELAKRLIELVADPKLQAEHDVSTTHLPVTKKASEEPTFKNDITLGKTTYMLDYTTFLPNAQGFPTYSKSIFGAIQAVELGKKTPEEALKDVETELKSSLGDKLKVVE